MKQTIRKASSELKATVQTLEVRQTSVQKHFVTWGDDRYTAKLKLIQIRMVDVIIPYANQPLS